MKTILPRLRNLLAMLAAENEPLPVKDVADRLRVSKRTVFRELANIDSVLAPYGLEVGSKPGEGVVLEGPPRARSDLLDDLDKMGRSDPADRRDRQDRLILALLQAPGQKLATYAERFKVSAATVSHDLDDIEPWLAERGLNLQRKSGAGINIAGEEMAVRRVILALQYRMEDPGGYPHPDILLDLHDLAPEMEPLLDWMTPQSRESLVRYIAVVVQRAMDGCRLEQAEAAPGEFMPTAERLATIVQEAFNIAPGVGEIQALAVQLAACRPSDPRRKQGGDDAALAALAAEMVTLFDSAQAPVLRMDEALMEGLVCHLRTMVVRIEHCIELADPMCEQIAVTYPDLIQRCRRACQALRPYGDWLPDDEVSLLAAHFGAALLRLSEQGAGRRTVRVGIICVHGIGSSYLLASQVRQAFPARVLVEVSWYGDRDNWREYDVLVSTTELSDAGVPVIVVPPILGEGDIRRIGALLSSQQAEPAAVARAPGAFVDDLRALEALVAAARNLLEGFSAGSIPTKAAFAELADAAGRRFGATEQAAGLIAQDLMAREKISTQVVPELGIVLLHCRTNGVDHPRFGIVRPDDGVFANPYFSGAQAAVVMLVPSSSPHPLSALMGSLSTALIEQESFLAAVKAGEAERVRGAVERIIAAYLLEFSLQKLKG